MADKTIFANQSATKPSVPKSLFDLSHANNLTAKIGKLYPCFLYDAPAGSSFHIQPRFGFDLMPMNFPIQSNIRAHLKFYKIPKRILWEDFKDFVGQHGNHVVPYISRTNNFHKQGSLADYMGIPSTKLTSQKRRVDYRALNGVNYYNLGSGVLSSVASSTNYVRFGTQFKLDKPLASMGLIFMNIYTAAQLQSSFTNDKFYVDFLGVDGHQYHNEIPFYDSEDDEPSYDFWDFERKNVSTVIDGVELYNSVVKLNISSLVSNINAMVADAPLYITIAWSNSAFGTPQTWHIPLTPNNQVIQGISEGLGEKLDYKKEFYIGTTGFTGWFSVDVMEYVNSEPTSPFVVGVGATAPKLPISVLPFRAYEFIYNYFFLNERVTPFKIDGVETYNKFITNAASGGDSTTPLELRDVPYEYDMFTTCLKTPQFGNAPLVGITTNSLSNEGIFHMVPEGSDPYDIGVEIGENSTILGISNYDEVADKPSVARLQEAIQFGISINDFRNVNCLQRFQERHLKAGTKYQNIVYEFFGTNPPIGEEFPEYIGGLTDDVLVSKITNTAKSEGFELGEFAGQAVFRSKGKKIKTFCSEESYIMGVIYFSVTPTYPQQLPRLFTKSHLLDFYNPQFSMIGPQPVYKHELTPLQLSVSNLFDVFGYNAPFSDYKSMRDEVHGEFRGSMANFLVQRRFATPPSLNSNFLYINSEDLTDVFSVQENTDKIFGQIWFDVKAKLPMPRYSVPRII